MFVFWNLLTHSSPLHPVRENTLPLQWLRLYGSANEQPGEQWSFCVCVWRPCVRKEGQMVFTASLLSYFSFWVNTLTQTELIHKWYLQPWIACKHHFVGQLFMLHVLLLGLLWLDKRLTMARMFFLAVNITLGHGWKRVLKSCVGTLLIMKSGLSLCERLLIISYGKKTMSCLRSWTNPAWPTRCLGFLVFVDLLDSPQHGVLKHTIDPPVPSSVVQ